MMGNQKFRNFSYLYKFRQFAQIAAWNFGKLPEAAFHAPTSIRTGHAPDG